MVKNKWMEILSSIGLTILIILFINLGISQFYPSPEFNDFCDINPREPKPEACTQQCVELWEAQRDSCFFNECGSGCGADGVSTFETKEECEKSNKVTCNNEFQDVNDNYKRNIFYLLAIIGVISLAIGLFTSNLVAQITGISSGFFLIIEGMIRNSRSTLTLFITTGFLIIVVIYLIFRFQRKE